MKTTPVLHFNDVAPEDLARMKRDGLRELRMPKPGQNKKLLRLISRMWALFQKPICKGGAPCIRGFFCYDRWECSGDFMESDAICSYSGEYSYIGIDVNVLDASENYIGLLLLHEIDHALQLDEGHTEAYHTYLNYLIMVYNQEYGTHIENDFSGWEGD